MTVFNSGAPTGRTLGLSWSPRQFSLTLGAAIGLLLLANLTVLWLHHGLGVPLQNVIVRMFHFDGEGNISTLFAAYLIVGAAVLLAMAGWLRGRNIRDRMSWFGLSVLFLMLAADEVFKIHETVVGPMLRDDRLPAILHGDWIVAYLGAGAVLALVYLRWFLRLPNLLKARFVISGVIFVAGAAGMEFVARGLVGSGLASEAQSLPGDLLATVEESLEKVGMALFCMSLFAWLNPVGQPARAESPLAHALGPLGPGDKSG